MLQILLIAIGGAVGSVLRYYLSNGVYLLVGRGLPYGTLAVNVIGSFVMGFLFVLSLERLNGLGSELRALLLVGLLGGFTTFSSFSIETLNLLENGETLGAIINILLSIVLTLLAVWLGVLLGRQL